MNVFGSDQADERCPLCDDVLGVHRRVPGVDGYTAEYCRHCANKIEEREWVTDAGADRDMLVVGSRDPEGTAVILDEQNKNAWVQTTKDNFVSREEYR